jgi:hypothetical protein
LFIECGVGRGGLLVIHISAGRLAAHVTTARFVRFVAAVSNDAANAPAGRGWNIH